MSPPEAIMAWFVRTKCHGISGTPGTAQVLAGVAWQRFDAQLLVGEIIVSVAFRHNLYPFGKPD